MNAYTWYQIYQAERPRTPAEQREADVRAGEIAAAIARFGRSLRHHAGAGKTRAGYGLAEAIAECEIPRPRQPAGR